MYHFQFLPHTADICLRLEADSLEELFLAALLGMNETLLPGACQRHDNSLNLSHELDMRSIDRAALLVDFLSEALTQSYIANTLFCELNIERLDDDRLQAVILGKNVEGFHDDIKAVTYHNAQVNKDEQGRWTATLVFDI
jgi:SHS2 domain-containing protein